MVNYTKQSAIVEREISKAGLDPVTAARVREWACRWAWTVNGKREYTERTFTTMVVNAVAHHGRTRGDVCAS